MPRIIGAHICNQCIKKFGLDKAQNAGDYIYSADPTNFNSYHCTFCSNKLVPEAVNIIETDNLIQQSEETEEYINTLKEFRNKRPFKEGYRPPPHGPTPRPPQIPRKNQ